MGTESFNYIRPALAHGENVALQHAVAGDQVTAKMRPDAAHGTNENVKPAGLFSTAPYLPDGKPPPKPRAAGREHKCLANDDTCNGWKTKTGYCWGHSKSMGLL